MSPSLAEIADKVPPLWAAWVIGLGLGFGTFAITRSWKPFAVIGLGAGTLVLNACASEFSGSSPLAIAVREEMGRFYVISIVVIPGALPIVGALLGWHYARLREMRLDRHDGQYHPHHPPHHGTSHPPLNSPGHPAAGPHGSAHPHGPSAAHRVRPAPSSPGGHPGHAKSDGRKGSG